MAATGVKQGDPLNGVLFIIVIDFLLQRIKKEVSCGDASNRNIFHYILAYVDEMLVMAKYARTLQALLNPLNELAFKVGLQFTQMSYNAP